MHDAAVRNTIDEERDRPRAGLGRPLDERVELRLRVVPPFDLRCFVEAMPSDRLDLVGRGPDQDVQEEQLRVMLTTEPCGVYERGLGHRREIGRMKDPPPLPLHGPPPAISNVAPGCEIRMRLG